MTGREIIINFIVSLGLTFITALTVGYVLLIDMPEVPFQ